MSLEEGSKQALLANTIDPVAPTSLRKQKRPKKSRPKRDSNSSSLKNQSYSSVQDIENFYEDEFGNRYYVIDHSPHSVWKMWTRWLLILSLVGGLVVGFVYLTLALEQEYSQVPDLIRVKKIHVLNNSTQPDQGVSVAAKKKKTHDRFPTKERMILVGDIHGNLKELQQLMSKVKFDPLLDQLVLLGDLISKGPNSIGVLDYAISNNASCVRGNHEDNILFAYTKVRHLPRPKVEPISKYKDDETALMYDVDLMYEDVEDDEEESTPADEIPNDDDEDGDETDGGSSDYNNPGSVDIKDSDIKIARALTAEHIEYLGTCPLIMDLGYVSKENTRAVAVHAGLHWDIKKLFQQPPLDSMTMRTLLGPKYKKALETGEGTQWSRIWNSKQKKKAIGKRTTVFYGHDARHGLNVRDYTFGLDSNCIGGGELTAMVITKLETGGLDHTIVSVPCAGVV